MSPMDPSMHPSMYPGMLPSMEEEWLSLRFTRKEQTLRVAWLLNVKFEQLGFYQDSTKIFLGLPKASWDTHTPS